MRFVPCKLKQGAMIQSAMEVNTRWRTYGTSLADFRPCAVHSLLKNSYSINENMYL